MARALKIAMVAACPEGHPDKDFQDGRGARGYRRGARLAGDRMVDRRWAPSRTRVFRVGPYPHYAAREKPSALRRRSGPSM